MEEDMAIDFQTFCDMRTVDVKIIIPDTLNSEVPELYKPTMERVLKDLSARTALFDHTSVPYIQETLECVKDMDEALSLTDGEIPNGILEEVSTTLYGKYFNDVEIYEQSIIIVVATYICVAKNSKID